MKKKAIVAYSGGLDTSYCVVNLSREHDLEIHTVIVNSGGFSAEELVSIEKRAYELARKGREAEIKPKTVEIKVFELTRIALPEIDFRVVCSKGTYIRSLARDLGVALGCGAHLTRLVRTRIGEYRLADAWTVAEVQALRPPRPEPADGATPPPRQRRERIKSARVGLDFYASQQALPPLAAGPDLPLHPEGTPSA